MVYIMVPPIGATWIDQSKSLYGLLVYYLVNVVLNMLCLQDKFFASVQNQATELFSSVS